MKGQLVYLSGKSINRCGLQFIMRAHFWSLLIFNLPYSLFLYFLSLQLHLVAGTGRPAGHTDHGAACLDHLHGRVLAVGQLPMQRLGVYEGCVHWGLRLYTDRALQRSLLCHCGSVAQVSCTW